MEQTVGVRFYETYLIFPLEVVSSREPFLLAVVPLRKDMGETF